MGLKIIGRATAFIVMIINILLIGLLITSAYGWYINPASYPIAACLGFIFPFLFIINVCFIFFWLIIRKYRFAIVPTIAMLLCVYQAWTTLPLNRHTNHIPEGSIKVLSYNIMAFNRDSKEAKKNGNVILRYLRDSKADIICLQEYSTEKNKKQFSQKDIEETLKDYPYHVTNSIGSSKTNKNIIACYSKYPILSSQSIEYRSDSNGSAVYELKIGNDTVTVINNHLESNKLESEDKDMYVEILKHPESSDKVKSGVRQLMRKLTKAAAIRSPQALSVAKVIAQSKNKHVIVCGDFNDIPLSYTHRMIGSGLTDAFSQSGRGLGISFNKSKLFVRIDNILCSKNFQSYNCTVDSSIKESDHYPIWCYLTMKKSKK